FWRTDQLPCVVLRTSRFFPEEDDRAETRLAYADANAKANEFLYRRVDIEDVVSAHLLAIDRAQSLGFARYIVSAPTPFAPSDLAGLRDDAPSVVRRLFPEYERLYARLGWRMFPSIDRVYDNSLAREQLHWRPHHDFETVLERLAIGEDPRSPLARIIGSK